MRKEDTHTHFLITFFFSLGMTAYEYGVSFIVVNFFIYFNWKLITLQYYSGFCHTLTWISHGCTCFPIMNPPPNSIPISSLRVMPVHQAWAPCLMHRTWTGDLFYIWWTLKFVFHRIDNSAMNYTGICIITTLHTLTISPLW